MIGKVLAHLPVGPPPPPPLSLPLVHLCVAASGSDTSSHPARPASSRSSQPRRRSPRGRRTAGLSDPGEREPALQDGYDKWGIQSAQTGSPAPQVAEGLRSRVIRIILPAASFRSAVEVSPRLWSGGTRTAQQRPQRGGITTTPHPPTHAHTPFPSRCPCFRRAGPGRAQGTMWPLPRPRANGQRRGAAAEAQAGGRRPHP